MSNSRSLGTSALNVDFDADRGDRGYAPQERGSALGGAHAALGNSTDVGSHAFENFFAGYEKKLNQQLAVDTSRHGSGSQTIPDSGNAQTARYSLSLWSRTLGSFVARLKRVNASHANHYDEAFAHIGESRGHVRHSSGTFADLDLDMNDVDACRYAVDGDTRILMLQCLLPLVDRYSIFRAQAALLVGRHRRLHGDLARAEQYLFEAAYTLDCIPRIINAFPPIVSPLGRYILLMYSDVLFSAEKYCFAASALEGRQFVWYFLWH